MPHIPCPLVQPLPIFVPKPTKNPPIIIRGREDVIESEFSIFVSNEYTSGPKTNPKRNNKLEILCCLVVNRLLTIPLTPASLPVLIKNKITEIPKIEYPNVVVLENISLPYGHYITSYSELIDTYGSIFPNMPLFSKFLALFTVIKTDPSSLLFYWSHNNNAQLRHQFEKLSTQNQVASQKQLQVA